MRPAARVGAFVAGLLLLFGGAAAVGSAFEPAQTDDAEMGAHNTEAPEGHAAAEPHASGEGHGESGTHSASVAPSGLGISADGLTLRLATTHWERGEPRQLRFAIEGADGDAVTDFDELHERRMHLIVVRRDGTGFRHLHPEMDADGTWAVPVEFDQPGVYRAFADFSVEGEQETLAADLFVSGGDFRAQPFPAPSPVDRSGGYEVRLAAGEPHAGAHSSLSFAVNRDGREVDDLAPYLGAKGHLVALREGDLAFLHVHPEEAGAPNEIVFDATFPTPGRYRLYLQFKHRGAVETVQFTLEVAR